MEIPQRFTMTPSDVILNELGYEYLRLEEEGSEPEYTDITFKDLIPEFGKARGRAKELADKKLYKHQLETMKALEKGYNVILISGTGSGKTEAWSLYTLMRKLRALVIYPTLALSQDQIERLREYYNAVGCEHEVVELDRPTLNMLGGYEQVLKVLSRALLVITNPAFLMADLKRIAVGKRSLLLPFLRGLDVIVLDELDYYGSRRATLLLALIETLQKYVLTKSAQIVVLTATLGNPEEIAEYLSKINNRKTKIIRGKPFKIKNITYLILGKNVKKVWKMLVDRKEEIRKKVPELLGIIEDFELFKKNIFVIMELLREYGFHVPEMGVDIIEILTEYAIRDEDYVTVVFTPSIRSAEKLAKRLRLRLEERGFPREIVNEVIVTHHHLIEPNKRREIEEKAREGKIRIIFTVRTLLQGIDIGRIARIVHYGIPEDVREFKQREGRKGRRREMPFSETIIIPIRPWDKRIVELGEEGLREYISLPLENVYINPNNKYILLFKALFKVRRYMEDLTKGEVELLRRFRLIDEQKGLFGSIVMLSDAGREVWNKLNFYEYGPPYGVNKILITDEGKMTLGETISWRDLVEKYQPGCFDYSNDAIVVDVDRGRVFEEDIRRAINKEEFLREAYDHYYSIKLMWGEDADIVRDYASGKLTSIVQQYIKVPDNGFGLLIEIPEAVIWEVESRRPRLIRRDGEYRTIYSKRSIPIMANVSGKYVDFTYGYVYELDPEEDVEKIRIGMALLKLALRLSKYRISLREIDYLVEERPKKCIVIWENDCSGILETVNWDEIRSFVKRLKPSKICELLLWIIDEEVATKIIEMNIPWNSMKEYALRALDYIQGVIRLKLRGLGEIRVPKPSKERKILSLDITHIEVNSKGFYVVTCFDGDSYKHFIIPSTDIEIVPVRIKTSEVSDLIKFISDAVDSGFKILIYDNEKNIMGIGRMSKTFSIIIKKLKEDEFLIDVHDIVKRTFKLDIAPLEELEKYLGLRRKIDVSSLREAYHKFITERTKSNLMRLIGMLERYGRESTSNIYLIYLICKNIKKNGK
ncbi:MAG: helicase [Thermoprotei archaeon]|nr:MAG: helicase [Thermoprotei archaeon]